MKYGNLCIAAHNYDNDKFFSKINLLSNNDLINIYNLNGDTFKYYVTDNYEVTFNDTSCTSQETFEKKQITLITCNNITGNRIIVKAMQK